MRMWKVWFIRDIDCDVELECSYVGPVHVKLQLTGQTCTVQITNQTGRESQASGSKPLTLKTYPKNKIWLWTWLGQWNAPFHHRGPFLHQGSEMRSKVQAEDKMVTKGEQLFVKYHAAGTQRMCLHQLFAQQTRSPITETEFQYGWMYLICDIWDLSGDGEQMESWLWLENVHFGWIWMGCSCRSQTHHRI